jgi:hypothetical protein
MKAIDVRRGRRKSLDKRLFLAAIQLDCVMCMWWYEAMYCVCGGNGLGLFVSNKVFFGYPILCGWVRVVIAGVVFILFVTGIDQ